MTNAEKTSNDFRRPERARIGWGKAMRGRGPGEGPNLSALGVAAHRCALLKQVQPRMRVQTSAIRDRRPLRRRHLQGYPNRAAARRLHRSTRSRRLESNDPVVRQLILSKRRSESAET